MCSIRQWHTQHYKIYGAFFRDSGKLAGYSIVDREDKYIGLCTHKTKPEYEKFHPTAALVNAIFEEHNAIFSSGGYINDGWRNLNHKTNFEAYLEKYFAFRKAYCHIHLEYNPKFKPLMKILRLFRPIFRILDSVHIIHQLNAVFVMEDIANSCSK